MHERNCFLTLTYSPENLPAFGSLDYSHFQRFMKRLRKRAGVPIRFYMCGEYGDNLNRPHYHACIFGFDFPDKRYFSRSGDNRLYSSEFLADLWPYGFSSIGDVTFESAAYVARYLMKKITGPAADQHYSVVDTSTGELFSRTPEFTRMSLKPGIGATWYDTFQSDVFPHDRVIIRGKAVKPPAYYFKRYANFDPLSAECLKYERYLDSLDHLSDNTTERLRARELHAHLILQSKKRGLK